MYQTLHFVPSMCLKRVIGFPLSDLPENVPQETNPIIRESTKSPVLQTHPPKIKHIPNSYHKHQQENILPCSQKQNSSSQTQTQCLPIPNLSKAPSIALIADSHGRNIANVLKGKLGSKTKVLSWLLPNAKVEDVMKRVDLESKRLGKGDCIVIIGGTNNVVNGRCNDFIPQLHSLLNDIEQQKVILVGLPTRFDDPSLTKTVSKVNSALENLARNHNHVSFVSPHSFSRSLHTRHGLHLNWKGKMKLADNIFRIYPRVSSQPLFYRLLLPI